MISHEIQSRGYEPLLEREDGPLLEITMTLWSSPGSLSQVITQRDSKTTQAQL